MEHIYHQGKHNKPVFILLHGTGGDEYDLIPLAETLDPDASYISLRGDVNENGLNRYFKRIKPGVFDEKDLVFRTKNMSVRIHELSKTYTINQDNFLAIGYSNGANILASVLFHYNDVIKYAILHHPMVPLRTIELPDLTDVHVLITAGKNDPICTKEESEELIEHLRKANADVEVFWTNNGHALTQEEVEKSKQWIKKMSSD